MYAKILVMLLGVSFAAAANLPPYLGANVELLQLMSAQMALGRSAGSLECFQHYIPKLNEITETYQIEYAGCESNATEQRSAVDKDSQVHRDSLDASGLNACQRLEICRSINETMPYFECYVKAGTDNSKAMYQISNEASDVLTDITERYRLIAINEDSCKTSAERNFVENTAATNDQLNKCLAGDGIPAESRSTA